MAWLDNDNFARPAHSVSPHVRDAIAHLRRCDDVLAKLIERYGPCTLKPSADYFNVLVETVISQQLSTSSAKAIYARLVELSGRRRPRPIDVLTARDDELLGVGLSRSKTEYIRNVAGVFRRNRMGPKTFARMDDEEVKALLTSIKGIGEWSAHMFLIFALHRLDVFPVGDLGLRKAIARQYRLRKPASIERIRKVGDRWKPFRTVGTWYLWESYDNG
jgi:DNA-3-methyladenine glycosylase II